MKSKIILCEEVGELGSIVKSMARLFLECSWVYLAINDRLVHAAFPPKVVVGLSRVHKIDNETIKAACFRIMDILQSIRLDVSRMLARAGLGPMIILLMFVTSEDNMSRPLDESLKISAEVWLKPVIRVMIQANSS